MNARRQPRHRLGVRWLLGALWVLGSFLTAVQAQVLPPSAAEALGQAQRSAAAALIEYDAHSPDRPLWVEALRLGREAAEAAPTHPAPQRFLAQAYQQVGFYARAWQAWEAYRTFGGTLDAVAERHVIEVARWMGIAAFDGGRRTEAIPYFEQLLVLAPFDLTANERLARTYIEGGEPLRARPYLEALAGAIPDLDDDLEYVRRLDAFGEAATQAYEAGLAAATAGDPATALARYRDATRDAPGFADAWRGLAETALALGQDGVAAQALERLLALVPDDARGLAVQATLQREETERLEAERLEAERLEAERLEAERAAALAAAEAAARAAADAEAARLATEREAAEAAAEAAARAAAEQDAAAEETAAAAAARTAAEAEAERVAAEAARAAQAEADRLAAEQEAARLAAEQEAARLAAEQEAARLAAEQEAARLAAEQEAARTATLDATASLTLGDVSHTHRAGDATANPSIAYVAAPGLRVDLSAHVDDVLYVRVTVLERSSDDPMWFQVCLVPPDVAVAPACSAADLLVLRAPGTYDAAVRWRDLGGAASEDWRNGVDALMWVLRRPDGTPVAGSGADASRYLPTALRVRTVAAPAGAALPDGR